MMTLNNKKEYDIYDIFLAFGFVIVIFAVVLMTAEAVKADENPFNNGWQRYAEYVKENPYRYQDYGYSILPEQMLNETDLVENWYLIEPPIGYPCMWGDNLHCYEYGCFHSHDYNGVIGRDSYGQKICFS